MVSGKWAFADLPGIGVTESFHSVGWLRRERAVRRRSIVWLSVVALCDNGLLFGFGLKWKEGDRAKSA